MGWINDGDNSYYVPDAPAAPAQQTGKYVWVGANSSMPNGGWVDIKQITDAQSQFLTPPPASAPPPPGDAVQLINNNVQESSLGLHGPLFKASDGYYTSGGQKVPGVTDSMIPGLQSGAQTRQQQAVAHNQADHTTELAALAGFGGLGALGALGAAGTGGLITPQAASSLAANAGGASLAPGATTLTGALESAVGNAGGMSLAPGSLAAGSAATSAAPSFIASLPSFSAATPFINPMAAPSSGLDPFIAQENALTQAPAPVSDAIVSPNTGVSPVSDATFNAQTAAGGAAAAGTVAGGAGTAASAGGALSRIMSGAGTASDYLSLGLPIAGAITGAANGSKPAGNTTTVQDLPDWLKPYVTGNLDAAKAYMAAHPQDNSLLAPASSQLNSTINGDYLNSNPGNAFYTGAQDYTNPALAGIQAGASGAYSGLNPGDAGFKAAQTYTNQGISALQPGASGAYVGTNPSDAFYKGAQGYNNAGINLLSPFASGSYVGSNPSDAYYKNAANYTNSSMDYLRPTASGAFLNSNPYIDALYQQAANPVVSNIDSQFSKAGRYGSGAMAATLGTTLGNLSTSIYGNNYAQERQNMLSAGNSLINADQAQQAARLAGAQGLGTNYSNDRAQQLSAANNIGSLDQSQQAARLAAAQGLGTNYANDRNLQLNYANSLTSADAAQQAARLAGTTGLSNNYNADANRQLDYANSALSGNQAQQASRLAAASGLSSNYNAARNNQLTAATAAPGFTADAATSPFAAFNAFGNLTKGLGVSQTSSPYFTNPAGGAISGALAGYGLSKAFA